MDATTLRKQLEQAAQHVVEGKHHIARQREIVSKLEGISRDASAARDLLRLFEEMQELHVTYLQRLQKLAGSSQ